MTIQEVEILVIGGGPGGYTAAIRAAQLGFTVALVEKAELGGVCLNRGCIPTKSLLHATDVLREIRSAGDLGITVDEPQIDFERMIRRSQDVAAQLRAGVQHLMRKNGIEVIKGEARLVSKTRVEVDGGIIEAGNIIIATGARPKNLPHVKIDAKLIWDAATAMNPPATV